MFTRRDGATPLPGFERKNVDDDLTFWGRFLSDGQPTINLGGIDVENLIIDATFLTIEVPEIGLLDDSDDERAVR